MRQIVYFSTATGRQDANVAAQILAVAREQNRLHSISGLLVAGGHRYLQVIEGPAPAIGALIDNICRDPRHISVHILADHNVAARSFDGWSMAFRDEPALSEFATFRDLVDQMTDAVDDSRLRGQIRCFARIFATSPVSERQTPWTLAPA